MSSSLTIMDYQKTLRCLKDRVRKAFALHRVSLPHHIDANQSASYQTSRVFKIKWNININDIKDIYAYWKNCSALTYAAGLSESIEDHTYHHKRYRKEDRELLIPVVLKLTEMISQHIKAFPPSQTIYGTISKPMCIEPYHLIILKTREANYIRSKPNVQTLFLRSLELKLFDFKYKITKRVNSVKEEVSNVNNLLINST